MFRIGRYCVAAVAALLLSSGTAHAALITIDFDTLATGSGLIGTPLVTSAGTVTLSATNGAFVFTPTTAGDGLYYGQGDDSSRALLSFDFDVTSITLSYAGHVGGAFNAEAVDGVGGALDSFVDPETDCLASDCFDGTISLSGAGIRGLLFGDGPGGRVVVIDSITLETADVPEPTSLALSATALAMLAARRRKLSSGRN